jgi:hypothetical protein
VPPTKPLIDGNVSVVTADDVAPASVSLVDEPFGSLLLLPVVDGDFAASSLEEPHAASNKRSERVRTATSVSNCDAIGRVV